jgi:branched-chain amino acid transport system substrate-binding protein
MPNANIPRAGLDLAAELKLKKIAILTSDEPFPAGLAAAAKAHAQRHGMEVVLDEKYPKGTKDFTLLLQKAKAAGADLFYPTSYEQDLMSMVAQMKQTNISFPYVFMLYASTPQFAEIGADGDYVFSHTNWHPSIRWKVNAGLDRSGFEAAYKAVNPKAEFEPDFQTVLAYSAAAVTERIVATAGTTDAQALRKAAADLSGKVVVLGGPYVIDAEGRQLGMPFPIVQRQPGKGMVSVFPADVASGKAIFPIPPWSQRK